MLHSYRSVTKTRHTFKLTSARRMFNKISNIKVTMNYQLRRKLLHCFSHILPIFFIEELLLKGDCD